MDEKRNSLCEGHKEPEDHHEPKTEKTSKGYEIPIRSEDEVMGFFKKVARKVPPKDS